MNTYADTIATLLDQDQTRDQIIIHLATSEDISINMATNRYADYARENNLTAVVTSHKEEALEWLGQEFDGQVWDHTAVRDAIVELQSIYSVAESTARDYTKAYSKSLGVTHPTFDPRQAMFDYLKSNADCTKAEFKEFAKDLGRSDSNINEYWKCMEFHRMMVNS